MVALILLSLVAPKLLWLYYRMAPTPITNHSDRVLLNQVFSQLVEQATSHSHLVPINTVTAKQLVARLHLPAHLAQRIVRYRNKLGGFVHVDQFDEIYGLSCAMSRRLKHQTHFGTVADIQKIDLNHSSFRQLVAHPYIDANRAKAMLSYRTHKGAFRAIDQIQQIDGYDPLWGKKITPYLSVSFGPLR